MHEPVFEPRVCCGWVVLIEVGWVCEIGVKLFHKGELGLHEDGTSDSVDVTNPLKHVDIG